MLQVIGFAVICVAGMSAGSDSILVPLGLALVGLVLIKLGERTEA